MEIVKIVKVKEKLREVKPCPFCGEAEEIYFEEYLHTGVGKRWRILCPNCMAGIDRGYDQNPGPLLDAWNKRI